MRNYNLHEKSTHSGPRIPRRKETATAEDAQLSSVVGAGSAKVKAYPQSNATVFHFFAFVLHCANLCVFLWHES